jgi:putative transposase
MESAKEDKVNYATLCRFVTELTQNPEFSFLGKLNSMARQVNAERAALPNLSCKIKEKIDNYC